MDRPSSHGAGALLLVDFQADFLAPNGRMPVAQGQVPALIEATQAAIETARDSGDVIVKVGNQFRRSDVIGNLMRRRAAIEGTPGTARDGRVDPAGAAYIAKWRSDAFCNPALSTLLEEADVRRMRLAGLYAGACITATAKGAAQRAFSVQVVGEATACRSDRSRAAALAKLRRAGIEVV